MTTRVTWVTPVRKGYQFECCDCGLVHSMDFRVKHIGNRFIIQFKVERDNKATKARRLSAKKRSGARIVELIDYISKAMKK